MSAIKVNLPGKSGTRVEVTELEEGTVFEVETSGGTEIGVRTDDGWITVDRGCVTSYIEDELNIQSEFNQVLPRPTLTCTITIE